MRFLVDENLPGDLVHAAQEFQHEARWSREFAPAASDTTLLSVLEQTGEILVTRDVRFANLVLGLMVSGVPLSGAVLVREESVKAIRVAWRGFLARGTEVQGLVVLTRDKSGHLHPRNEGGSGHDHRPPGPDRPPAWR